MQIRKVFFKTLGALMALAMLFAALSAGQAQAQSEVGSITVNIKDLQGDDIGVGPQVRGDLWGVSQPTGGGAYTWHHMNKDAVLVGVVSSVTWTKAEIDAEVDLGANNFWFAANAWGGNPWANTQISSPTGLWGTFISYDSEAAAASWDVRVITADVFPAHYTSSGVYYDLDLSGVLYSDPWASVNVTYQDCEVDLQPVLSAETKAYMESLGYEFSFEPTTGMLTITNVGTGFYQAYSAREDGVGGYVQELDTLGDGVVSYDDTNKQFIVDINYAALGLSEGDTYFVNPGFQIDLVNSTTYSDLEANAKAGYVRHTLDPLVVVAPVHIGETGYFTIQSAIDAASDGDTIEVSPGTYIEGTGGEKALDLTVANLTVRSTDGRDVTIIDANGATTGVWVNQNLGTVTFDGFTVKNFVANGVVQSYTQREGTAFHILNSLVDSSNGYLRNGLQVSGDNSTVKNNIVYGAPLDDNWSSTGIGVINANNVLVSGNTVQGDIEDASNPDIGINVMNHGALASDITIEQNTVKNAGDGVRISAADPSYVVKNVTIDNNIINENTWGINVQKAVLDDVTITNNTIQSNHDDLLDDDGPLYGTGIRFSDESATVTNASISGNTFSDNETYQVFGHTGALIDVPAVLSANTFDNAVTIDGDYVIYSSIQDAIDDASDGDTINVAAGTYVESYSSELALKIDKPISLIGTGLPTVDGNSKEKVVQVTADYVAISGMRFVNADAGAGIGIYLFGVSNTTISSCESSNNKIGLLLAGVNGSTIEDNALVDNSYRSIVIQQNSDGNIVKGNTITMSGTDTLDGIVIGSDSGGNVIGAEGQPNTINMPLSTTQESSAVHLPRAIYLEGVGASNNVIQYNSINGSASAIQIDGNSGTTTVDHNIIGQTIAPSFRGVQINGGSLVLTNNTIKDSVRPVEFWGAANVTIIGNTIDGTTYDFINVGSFTGTVIIEENAFVNITGQALLNQTATSVDASPNWWGSVAGPAAGQISDNVDYIPWCGDANCDPANLLPNDDGEIDLTPPGGETLAPEEIQAAINNAPEGTTIIIPAGTYQFESDEGDGFVINSSGLTINLNGATIGAGSPAFTVTADNTIINGPGVLDGTGDTENSPAILVKDPDGESNGVFNLTVSGLEIKNWANGIYYENAITNTQIVDNYIHNLTGDGVHFTQQPIDETGMSFFIQGNLFDMITIGGFGVNAPDDLDVTYNSWGSKDGPVSGDLPIAIISYDPITHVNLDMVSTNPDVGNWLNQVFVGDEITYQVKAHVVNLTTASFDFTYPTALLDNPEINNVNTQFYPVPTKDDVVTVSSGEISFDGQTGEKTPLPSITGDIVLFEVTFTAKSTTGVATLDFNEDTDEFGMFPGSGPSLNIYAAELTDGSVQIIDLPTMSSADITGPYVAGIQKEFNVTTNNPATGGEFDLVRFNFTIADALVADIYSLEYFDGTAWQLINMTQDGNDVVGYFGPVEGFPMSASYDVTTKFRVIFQNPSTYALTVTLDDLDTSWTLATLAAAAVVDGDFDVTGTVSMQGRTVRSGVPMTLTDIDGEPIYDPFDAISTSELAFNVHFTSVNGSNYEITTLQPRYLNVHEGLDKFLLVKEDETIIEALELKGGNAEWIDNVINLSDASIVGTYYGIGDITFNADVNFDDRVNIFDLALVGGNYNLTSETAYTDWTPTP